MKFSAFNLSHFIQQYNAAHGTAFGPTHHFGLGSLSANVQKELQEVCDLFETAAQNTSGLMPTSNKTRLKKNIASGVSKGEFKEVRENLKHVREDNRHLKAFHWYATNQKQLAQEELWNNFERSANSNNIMGNVLFLKRWWRRHEDFAHYTSTGIWYVATSIMTSFENFVSVASVELMRNKRKLPAMVYQEYDAYLKNLDDTVAKTKSKLCWAMLARLEVADQNGSLNFDDVMMHLAWKLQSNELLKANDGFIKSPRHGLSSELFNCFHRYILINGDPEQKEALLKLSWFKSLNNCVVFKTDKQLVVIPKKIVDEALVPKKVRFKKIFRYAHFRYNFFHGKLSVMASLERILRDDDKSRNLDFSSFRDLQNKYEETRGLLTMMDKHCSLWQPKGLLKIFCKPTLRFIQIWKEFSTDRQEQLIHKQVDSIVTFSRGFYDRFNNVDNLKMLLPLDQVYYLSDKINMFLKINRDEVRNRALRGQLQSLTTLKNMAMNESAEIKPKISREAINKKNEIAKAEGVLATIQSLDIFSLSDEKFQHIMYCVHSAAMELDMQGGVSKHTVLVECTNTIFIQYLEYCVALVNKDAGLSDQRTKDVEELLGRVSEGHIIERLLALQKMKDDKVDPYVIQLKCESYIHCYAYSDVDLLGLSDQKGEADEPDFESEEDTESSYLVQPGI